MRLLGIPRPEDEDISPDLLVGDFDPATAEREMTLAFKRGEKGAYQAIHNSYASKVYGVCRRMLLNHEDAEEAAQETFLKVYQALGRFNGRYQLGAWISRIATNVCLDHIRARARRPRTTEASLELLELDTDHFENSEPEEVVIRNSESRHVRRVLAKLPPIHRAAIVLRDFEGLSYDEIATALDLSDCQVKALIHRARQGFKRSWAREFAGALVPVGLIERFRRLSLFGRDSGSSPSIRMAEAVSPSMQTIASCATFAQQCGQAFAERVAPVAMAFLVGGSTVGAAALASEREEDPHPTVSVERDEPLPLALDVRSHHRDATTADEEVLAPTQSPPEPEAPPAEPVEGEDKPTTQPAPDGYEEPGDAPEPGPTTPPAGTPDEEPREPEPQGFAFSFETDVAFQGRTCECMSSAALSRERTFPDENGSIDFSQALTGSAIAQGTTTYGLMLQHAAEAGRSYSAVFGLQTQEGDYRYTANGALVSQSQTSWGGESFTYAGTYELNARPSTRETVPEVGRFTATVVYSRTQARMVGVSISLTEGR